MPLTGRSSPAADDVPTAPKRARRRCLRQTIQQPCRDAGRRPRLSGCLNFYPHDLASWSFEDEVHFRACPVAQVVDVESVIGDGPELHQFGSSAALSPSLLCSTPVSGSATGSAAAPSRRNRARMPDNRALTSDTVHLDHFRTSHTICVPKLVQIPGQAATLMLAQPTNRGFHVTGKNRHLLFRRHRRSSSELRRAGRHPEQHRRQSVILTGRNVTGAGYRGLDIAHTREARHVLGMRTSGIH